MSPTATRTGAGSLAVDRSAVGFGRLDRRERDLARAPPEAEDGQADADDGDDVAGDAEQRLRPPSPRTAAHSPGGVAGQPEGREHTDDEQDTTAAASGRGRAAGGRRRLGSAPTSTGRRPVPACGTEPTTTARGRLASSCAFALLFEPDRDGSNGPAAVRVAIPSTLTPASPATG